LASAKEAEVDDQLGAALIGLVVGAVGAWVKAALAIRAKTNEELRARRLELYPELWRQTAAFSYWPPIELTRAQLVSLNLATRSWYFDGDGGLFLSENGRHRYGELKQLLSAYIELADPAEPLDRGAYDALAATASALRTGMTEDLETRRQRSLWWVVAQWARHVRQHRRWRRRYEAIGGGDIVLEAYPLSELDAPSTASRAPESAEDIAAAS
jgi:hypothetical protein